MLCYVNLQGMFDLSKFMIGSGSDGESDHIPVSHKSELPAHEELEPRVENIADGQAEEQEEDDRSNAVQLLNKELNVKRRSNVNCEVLLTPSTLRVCSNPFNQLSGVEAVDLQHPFI